MNLLFAAGLFDQPWLVLVFLIVGVISNWLMKRRQEKEAGPQPEGNEPPPSSKPPGEFNLEETLRRLMGEEPPSRPPSPPPIPRAAQGESPPVQDWPDPEQLQSEQTWRKQAEEGEEEIRQPATQAAPPLRPPPLVAAERTSTMTSEASEQTARRFEQLNEQGRHPATVVGGAGRERRLHAGTRSDSPWRNRRSLRRAFVASLVFAPPKGLEP
jgi:hypothetical protein